MIQGRFEPTQDEINRIFKMRQEKKTWKEIGRYFHRKSETVRAAVDPEYRRFRNARHKTYRPPARNIFAVEQARELTIQREPLYDPRRDGLPEWRSVGAYLMGEPPIGRSALERKGFGTSTRSI
jgi:hypothetical protein